GRRQRRPFTRGTYGGMMREGEVVFSRAEITQCGAGGPVAAHAMHAAAGGRGRGAEIESLGGHTVGVQADDGAGEELPEILHTAVDIAADKVRIVRLILGCRAH